MEYNKSLSARSRRRNKCAFAGVGTGLGFLVRNPGDYLDPTQNNKMQDYVRESARKAKLGFKRIGKGFSLHKRALTKKFADNHQKAAK